MQVLHDFALLDDLKPCELNQELFDTDILEIDGDFGVFTRPLHTKHITDAETVVRDNRTLGHRGGSPLPCLPR